MIDLSLDLLSIKQYLENHKISARWLRETLGFTRSLTDQLSKSEELNWPLDKVDALAQSTGIDTASLIGEDNIRVLELALPFVEEGDYESGDTYHLVRLEDGEEIHNSFVMSFSTLFGPMSRPEIKKDHDQETKERLAMEYENLEGYKKLVDPKIKWLATAPHEVVTRNAQAFKNFQAGLLESAKQRKPLSVGAADLDQFIRDAERLDAGTSWHAKIEAEDYKIFHIRIDRPTVVKEVWGDTVGYDENRNREIQERWYEYLWEPQLATHFFIVANPEDEYVLLRAQKKSRFVDSVDLEYQEPSTISMKLMTKYGYEM
jgi:hypothetical protein